MKYLSRDAAPFGDEFWTSIDRVVNEAASKKLIGRKFLPIYGPLGPGAIGIHTDKSNREEVFEDGVVCTTGRKFSEISQIYQDFTILWRDIENNKLNGMPFDYSVISYSSQELAKKEDKIILHGHKGLGYEGLFNAQGSQQLKISDWGKGENPFTDVVKAINMLQDKDIFGEYHLIISHKLYVDLQRIQSGTGITEYKRVSDILTDIHRTPLLQNDQAILVCPEIHNMDLVIGQDIKAAYLEQVDLNHHLRIFETLLLRIKNSLSIVVIK